MLAGGSNPHPSPLPQAGEGTKSEFFSSWQKTVFLGESTLNMAKLYIVATPIGNLGDITVRAIETLKQVQLIAAEDTRQSKKLLVHYGINTPLLALHAHNEREQSAKILAYLEQDQSVAYITDAGTPLISDPGAQLVNFIRQHGFQVVPIPGPCAAIAALSTAGIPEPHFYFEGFLPNKSSTRVQCLARLKDLPCTLIFYESPHRITSALADMQAILGNRTAFIARELTKKFETILKGTLQELIAILEQDPKQQLGEFVVLVSGRIEQKEQVSQEKIDKTLQLLLQDLPIKKTVAIASELLGLGRNELYERALLIKNK